MNELEAARAVIEIGERRRRDRKSTPRGQRPARAARWHGRGQRAVHRDDGPPARGPRRPRWRGRRPRRRDRRARSPRERRASRRRRRRVPSRARPPTRNIASAARVMATYARRCLSARSRRRVVAYARANDGGSMTSPPSSAARTAMVFGIVPGAEGDARGPLLGTRRRCPDLGHEHDWEIQPLARVHREQPHGVVVLRKSRSLRLGELLLGRIVKPLPKGSSIVVAIGDARSLRTFATRCCPRGRAARTSSNARARTASRRIAPGPSRAAHRLSSARSADVSARAPRSSTRTRSGCGGAVHE